MKKREPWLTFRRPRLLNVISHCLHFITQCIGLCFSKLFRSGNTWGKEKTHNYHKAWKNITWFCYTTNMRLSTKMQLLLLFVFVTGYIRRRKQIQINFNLIMQGALTCLLQTNYTSAQLSISVYVMAGKGLPFQEDKQEIPLSWPLELCHLCLSWKYAISMILIVIKTNNGNNCIYLTLS